MEYLTERQRDVLGFVRDRIRSVGVAPTLQEISDRFGFSSTASAQKHVNLLERKGFLRRVKHQKRGLVLGPAAEEEQTSGSIRVPLLGTVAAGSPIESIAGDERITVPDEMIGNGDHYVLRVRGDSMIDEGIHDGDLVVIEQKTTAREGEMIVALVGGEVTLKRLYKEPAGMLRLQPSNPEMQPLMAPSSEVRVQGSVVGLLRRY